MRQKKKKKLLYASSLSKLTPFSELPTSVIYSFNKHRPSVYTCRAVLMVGGRHTGSLPAGAHPQALVHPREGLSLKPDNRFLLLCPLPQHSHPGFSPSPSHPPILRPHTHLHPLPPTSPLPTSLFPKHSSGLLGGSEGEESTCDAGDLGSILGSGRFPGVGNGNPF